MSQLSIELMRQNLRGFYGDRRMWGEWTWGESSQLSPSRSSPVFREKKPSINGPDVQPKHTERFDNLPKPNITSSSPSLPSREEFQLLNRINCRLVYLGKSQKFWQVDCCSHRHAFRWASNFPSIAPCNINNGPLLQEITCSHPVWETSDGLSSVSVPMTTAGIFSIGPFNIDHNKQQQNCFLKGEGFYLFRFHLDLRPLCSGAYLWHQITFISCKSHFLLTCFMCFIKDGHINRTTALLMYYYFLWFISYV